MRCWRRQTVSKAMTRGEIGSGGPGLGAYVGAMRHNDDLSVMRGRSGRNMQVKGRKVGAAAGLVAGVVSVALLVAGCGPIGTAADSPAAPVSPAGAAASDGPPALQASVAAGSTTVSPGEPITVAAVRGTLNDVKLMNQAGTVVPGSTSPDGTKWTSSGQLGYGKTYTLQAAGTSTDPARTPLNAAATFSTVTARTLTLPYLTPSDGKWWASANPSR